jgi:hypothetical protein
MPVTRTSGVIRQESIAAGGQIAEIAADNTALTQLQNEAFQREDADKHKCVNGACCKPKNETEENQENRSHRELRTEMNTNSGEISALVDKRAELATEHYDVYKVERTTRKGERLS